MTDYGPSFEFLDSRLDSRWTEGKFRVPTDVDDLMYGQIVTANFTTGEIELAPLDSVIVPKVTGLFLQELAWDYSIFGPDPVGMDTYSYGFGKPGGLGLITGGAGVKIRVKNLAGVTRSDGRVIGGRTMYATTGSLAAGDNLAWDGTKFIKAGQGGTSATAVVAKAVSVSSAGLELVLQV